MALDMIAKFAENSNTLEVKRDRGRPSNRWKEYWSPTPQDKENKKQ